MGGGVASDMAACSLEAQGKAGDGLAFSFSFSTGSSYPIECGCPPPHSLCILPFQLNLSGNTLIDTLRGVCPCDSKSTG